MTDFAKYQQQINQIDEISQQKCVRVMITSSWDEIASLWVSKGRIVDVEVDGLADKQEMLDEISSWAITDIHPASFPRDVPNRMNLPFSTWTLDLVTPLDSKFVGNVAPPSRDDEVQNTSEILVLVETLVLAAYENFEVSCQQQGARVSPLALLSALIELVNALLDAVEKLANDLLFSEIFRRIRVHQPPLQLHGTRLHPDLATRLADKDSKLIRENDIPILLDLIHVIQPYSLKSVGFSENQVNFLSLSLENLEQQIKTMMAKW